MADFPKIFSPLFKFSSQIFKLCRSFTLVVRLGTSRQKKRPNLQPVLQLTEICFISSRVLLFRRLPHNNNSQNLTPHHTPHTMRMGWCSSLISCCIILAYLMVCDSIPINKHSRNSLQQQQHSNNTSHIDSLFRQAEEFMETGTQIRRTYIGLKKHRRNHDERKGFFMKIAAHHEYVFCFVSVCMCVCVILCFDFLSPCCCSSRLLDILSILFSLPSVWHFDYFPVIVVSLVMCTCALYHMYKSLIRESHLCLVITLYYYSINLFHPYTNIRIYVLCLYLRMVPTGTFAHTTTDTTTLPHTTNDLAMKMKRINLITTTRSDTRRARTMGMMTTPPPENKSMITSSS